MSCPVHRKFGRDPFPPRAVNMTICKCWRKHHTSDGAQLYSGVHPRLTPLWKRLLMFFHRLKLSKDNLEKAKTLDKLNQV